MNIFFIFVLPALFSILITSVGYGAVSNPLAFFSLMIPFSIFCVALGNIKK